MEEWGGSFSEERMAKMFDYISVGYELSPMAHGHGLCHTPLSTPPSSDLRLKSLHLQADRGSWSGMHSQCEADEIKCKQLRLGMLPG